MSTPVDKLGIVEKTCSKCKISQVRINFSRSSHALDGLHWICKKCDSARLKFEYRNNPTRRTRRLEAAKKWKDSNLEKFKYNQRNAKLRRSYGITYSDYDQLRKSQNGRCKLCEKLCGPKFHDMRVDHDHINGKVRALLCPTCNTGLGQFGDSVLMLKRAITYLESYAT